MIDILKAEKEFQKYIDQFDIKDNPSFILKIVHTNHVINMAVKISKNMGLSKEDCDLAKLIAILHDIGRFEELRKLSKFDSVGSDHASLGVKLLFEDGLIRTFIEDKQYDEVIKEAIGNHSRMAIREGLSDRALLHARLLRDADKIDNYRVFRDDTIESRLPGIVKDLEEFERSSLSDVVYEAVREHRCVDIHDRVHPLDYLVCVLAFTFDINFKESFYIIKVNHYIDDIINRFSYKDEQSRIKMEEIRCILNDYIDDMAR